MTENMAHGLKNPPEYSANLLELQKAGEEETPVLEFDEAPVETKDIPRILFSRSVVWLPEGCRGIDHNNLALTISGIVSMPSPGKDGYFFCFASP